MDSQPGIKLQAEQPQITHGTGLTGVLS